MPPIGGWLGLENGGDSKGFVQCKVTSILAVINDNVEITEVGSELYLTENRP